MLKVRLVQPRVTQEIPFVRLAVYKEKEELRYQPKAINGTKEKPLKNQLKNQRVYLPILVQIAADTRRQKLFLENL